jgi:hypothetical protein
LWSAGNLCESIVENRTFDLYGIVLKSQNGTAAMMETQQPTSIAPPTRSTNWWGLSSTVGLFVWVLFWLKREPRTTTESILCWGTLVAIHFAAIKAARRRYGWFYLAPVGLFWILVIIALSGGISY